MIEVYLETAPKRTFAAAVEWPGWARSARDDSAALDRLIEYGPRYRRSMGLRAPAFVVPGSSADLKVVQRIEGNDSTDYGVLGRVPKADERPTEEAGLDRLVDLLRRAWAAFTDAADRAEGHELGPSGPRGGGRSLTKMRSHVEEAEAAYLMALGGRATRGDSWPELQRKFVDAIGARVRGELPETGPRGGRRWGARYAVRRSAWHALDHAWEIEDRVED